MTDTVLVSLAVSAGLIGLVGAPLRCWQILSGRFRDKIPPHAIARATFSLFSAIFLVPNALAWTYALYGISLALACSGDCSQQGVAGIIATGLLGCAYALLEGFLLSARRRSQPGKAAVNSATKRA